MTTPLAEQLARAIDSTGRVLAAVDESDWARPTVCEWDVRGLVNHVVAGNRLFERVVAGTPAGPGAAQGAAPSDHLGLDPVAAYHRAGADLLAVVGQPGLDQRDFRTPIGLVPGSALINLRITEVLVHGWDIAAATGTRAAVADDLAEAALAFSRAQLEGGLSRSGRFGPEQPVGVDASAIDRLAAYLGRPVERGRAV